MRDLEIQFHWIFNPKVAEILFAKAAIFQIIYITLHVFYIFLHYNSIITRTWGKLFLYLNWKLISIHKVWMSTLKITYPHYIQLKHSNKLISQFSVQAIKPYLLLRTKFKSRYSDALIYPVQFNYRIWFRKFLKFRKLYKLAETAVKLHFYFNLKAFFAR